MKVIIVCQIGCKEEPYTEKIGNQTMNFCCENGFKKSLSDFKNSLNN